MGQSELTGWKLITESEQFFVKIAANLNGTKIAAQFFYLLTLIFVYQTIWNNFLHGDDDVDDNDDDDHDGARVFSSSHSGPVVLWSTQV